MRKAFIKSQPWCPFCRQNIARPGLPARRKLGEFPAGRCQCQAVYVADATGHNIGAAMVECLVTACGDNWDLAWELLPEDDYLIEYLENYDEKTHQVVDTKNLDGRKVRGVVVFIRLQKDIGAILQSVNQDGAGDGPAAIAGIVSSPLPVELEPARDPKRIKQRASKEQVQKLVAEGEIDALVDLCFDDKRTLRFFQRLLYDPDENKRWTVANIMGKVYTRVSTRKPGQVSEVLHRLFESCADSSAANWGAVEAIGEIIAGRPDIYGAFTRHLLKFAGDSSMQVQVLWALGTIAGKRPDLIRRIPFYGLFAFLGSPDPLLRGLCLRLLGRIEAREVLGRIKEMAADKTSVLIYEDGRPQMTEIGQLAAEAVSLIDKQGEDKIGHANRTAGP